MMSREKPSRRLFHVGDSSSFKVVFLLLMLEICITSAVWNPLKHGRKNYQTQLLGGIFSHQLHDFDYEETLKIWAGTFTSRLWIRPMAIRRESFEACHFGEATFCLAGYRWLSWIGSINFLICARVEDLSNIPLERALHQQFMKDFHSQFWMPKREKLSHESWWQLWN